LSHPKFPILGCAWKTLNKINNFNIWINLLDKLSCC
jgi:hypothetical protein